MGMFLMDVADHLLTVGILLCQEVHSIPEVVGAPVLPVLDDTVEGHLQRTVLIDDTEELGGTLVTLLALPEAVGPQREHRYITREMAHLGNHAVGRATVHEIVIDTVADLGGERHAFPFWKSSRFDCSISLCSPRRLILPFWKVPRP